MNKQISQKGKSIYFATEVETQSLVFLEFRYHQNFIK